MALTKHQWQQTKLFTVYTQEIVKEMMRRIALTTGLPYKKPGATWTWLGAARMAHQYLRKQHIATLRGRFTINDPAVQANLQLHAGVEAKGEVGEDADGNTMIFLYVNPWLIISPPTYSAADFVQHLNGEATDD